MRAGRPRVADVAAVRARLEWFLRTHGGAVEQSAVRADLRSTVLPATAALGTCDLYIRRAVKGSTIRVRRRRRRGRGNVWVNVLESR